MDKFTPCCLWFEQYSPLPDTSTEIMQSWDRMQVIFEKYLLRWCAVCEGTCWCFDMRGFGQEAEQRVAAKWGKVCFLQLSFWFGRHASGGSGMLLLQNVDNQGNFQYPWGLHQWEVHPPAAPDWPPWEKWSCSWKTSRSGRLRVS